MARSHFPRPPHTDVREILAGFWWRSFNTVRRTPGLLLLSLGLGIAVWFFVTEEENPTRSGLFASPIEVVAVNVGREVAVANALPSASIRIAAPADRWDSLTSANFRAIVDLSGLSAREQLVPVHVDVNDARGVRVISADPPEILVNLEQIVTREIPVDARIVGTLPRGFAAGGAVPDPANVEVSGPESLVGLVVSAGADINVTGLTLGISQSLRLVARGAGGGEIRRITIMPPNVRIDVAIEQTVLTSSRPLHVELLGQPAPGYRVDGVQIQPAVFVVEGSFDVLQTIDSLTLGQVLLDGARANLSVVRSPTLPPGVSAVSPEDVDVIVSIAPIQGSTAITVVPRLIGVPTGLRGALGQLVITVVIEGDLPILNALDARDIRAEVDASGLVAGVSQVDVLIEAPPGVRVREVRPPLLELTLEAIATPTPTPTATEAVPEATAESDE